MELLEERNKSDSFDKLKLEMEAKRKQEGIEKREFYSIKDYIDDWCRRPGRDDGKVKELYRKRVQFFRKNKFGKIFSVCRGNLSSFDEYGNVYITRIDEIITTHDKIFGGTELLKYNFDNVPIFEKNKAPGVYKRHLKNGYFRFENIFEITLL